MIRLNRKRTIIGYVEILLVARYILRLTYRYVTY